MNINLNHKNALVCGGSQGIGKATAIELALMGANVTLFARNAERLQAALAELPNNGHQEHDYIVADFGDTELVVSVVKNYMRECNKTFQVLINNTGGPAGGAIVDATSAQLLAAYQAHLLVSHNLSQLLIEGMQTSGYGRIINIISTSVKEPIAGLGVSNTTRWAVAAWAKTLSGEVGKWGITVNNVLPGFTATQRLETIIDNKVQKTKSDNQTIIKQMYAEVPLQRFAEPHEVAAAVAFLASPAAAYISGINLPVDGGRTKSL